MSQEKILEEFESWWIKQNYSGAYDALMLAKTLQWISWQASRAQANAEIARLCEECKTIMHSSDCAVHNAPAYPSGPCDCGALPKLEGES